MAWSMYHDTLYLYLVCVMPMCNVVLTSLLNTFDYMLRSFFSDYKTMHIAANKKKTIADQHYDIKDGSW